MTDQRRVLGELIRIYHETGKPAEEQRYLSRLEKLRTPIGEAMEKLIEKSGIDSAIEQYRELFRVRSEKYDFDENELNELGYSFLRKNKTNEAIKIFELNTWSYPEGYNTYDSLGEAYMVAGNRTLAIQNYEKSRRLNPKNVNALEKLKKLRTEQVLTEHP